MCSSDLLFCLIILNNYYLPDKVDKVGTYTDILQSTTETVRLPAKNEWGGVGDKKDGKCWEISQKTADFHSLFPYYLFICS